MEKQQAIEILKKKRSEINGLKNLSNTSSSLEFTKWHRDTKIAIQKIFNLDNNHTRDFTSIKYSPSIYYSDWSEKQTNYHRPYVEGLDKANAVLSSFIDEINNYWNDDIPPVTSSISPIEKVE
ncbi:MAG: Uncharacterized protein CG439_632, partial [Methylococcaceae bacterium NSP1-2]